MQLTDEHYAAAVIIRRSCELTGTAGPRSMASRIGVSRQTLYD